MAAGSFKVHCLAVMDEVQAKREAIVITKYGKPVVKLVPADKDAGDIYGFLAGNGAVIGDAVSPAISSGEWGELKRFSGYAGCGVAGIRPGSALEKGASGDRRCAPEWRWPRHLRHHAPGVGRTFPEGSHPT